MENLDNSVASIRGIETWYKEQCNGDWEHSYGISITTLDNPGWYVEIDLVETDWSHVTKPLVREQRTNSDWVQSEVGNGKFVGSGGIANLGEILRIFLQIIGHNASLGGSRPKTDIR